MTTDIKQVPSDQRIWSGAQAADIQRLSYNVCVKLNKQLGKATSLATTLAIAGAVEKLSRVWQSAHDTVQSKRQKRASNGHAGRTNGNAGPRRAQTSAPLETVTPPLSQPETPQSSASETHSP